MSLKIVHVIPTLGEGGAARLTMNLAIYQCSVGHDVKILTLFSPRPGSLDGPMANYLQHRGIKTYFLGKRLGLDITMFRKLDSFVRGFKPHVLHTHGSGLRYSLLAILGRRASAYVHTIHTIAQYEAKGRLDRILRHALFHRFVSPVSISRAVTKSITSLYGRAPRAEIVNAIPVKEYQFNEEQRRAWRRKAGFSPDDVLFVCVAMLRKEKNHDLLLDAFAQGVVKQEKAHLLLVGDGEMRSHIEAKIDSLGLRARVHLLGYRTDVFEILSASDVFVLASAYEGSPLAVMEAMAAGRPVVAPAVGGLPELVVDGETGMLVESGSTRQMAKALNRLASDRSLREYFGQRAAEQAKRFDLPVMGEAYDRLYEELLGIRRADGTLVG